MKMDEVTVKRVCKPGWKNCKMPILRQRIADLEVEPARLQEILLRQTKLNTKAINKTIALKTKLDAVTEAYFEDYPSPDKFDNMMRKLVNKVAIGEQEQSE